MGNFIIFQMNFSCQSMSYDVLSSVCHNCGKTLRGRSDKKFCDDACRNNYNNRLKGSVNNFVRNINNVLSKNRRILENILSGHEETATVNKDKLLRLGFQFNYLTNIYTTRSGKTYYYCYDHGYLPLDNDWYLVVRRKEQN